MILRCMANVQFIVRRMRWVLDFVGKENLVI